MYAIRSYYVIGQPVVHEVGADKPGTAGDKQFFHSQSHS